MTWLADVQQNRPNENEATALKLKREQLMIKLKDFQANVGKHKSVAAARFHQEDLTKIASEIVKIDKKLGRL